MSGERRHKEERKEKEEKSHKEKKEKKSLEEKKERSDRKDKSARKDRHEHRTSSREKERRSPSSHSPSSASSSGGGGGAASRDVLPPGSPSHGALSAKKFRALLDAEPAPQGRRRAMSMDTSEAMAPKEINTSSLRSSNATESSPPRRPSSRDGTHKEKEMRDKDKKEKSSERKEHKEKDSKDTKDSTAHTQKLTKKSVAIVPRTHQSSPSKSSGRSKSGASPARPRSPSVSISVSSASDDELLSSDDDHDLPRRRSGLSTSASSASSAGPATTTASAPPPVIPPVSIKQASNEPRAPKSVRIAADAKTTDAPSRAPDSPVLLWIYWTGKSARSVFVATSLDGERTLFPLPFRPHLGVHGAALLAPAGRVSYRFLVNYVWMHDPNQPSVAAQSGPTSLLNWRLASGVHTVAAEFRWPRGTEKSVAVAGSWNNWSLTPLTNPSSSSNSTSSSSSSPYWTVTVPLSPGMHVYKFIIDGVSWRIDPSAHSCKSPEGHINSWRIV